MHSQNQRPARGQRETRDGERSRITFGDGPIGQSAEQPFPRNSQADRPREPAELAEPCEQFPVVCPGLAEANSWIQSYLLRGYTLVRQLLQARLERTDRLPPRLRRDIADRVASSVGVPCMCITTTPALRATRGICGSPDNPVTSLTIVAPESRARRATSAFEVSTEMITPSFATPATTGRTRCNSSDSETGVAPGRVDSPPISRMSAPSAINCRACAMAAFGIEELAAVRKAVRRDVHDAHDERAIERQCAIRKPPDGSHADRISGVTKAFPSARRSESPTD